MPPRHRGSQTGRLCSRVFAPTAVVFAVALAACSSTPSTTSTTKASTGTTAPADPYAQADLKAPAGALTGAGSTFDQPFFTKAFYAYNQQNSGVTVNYASIGSGGGIQQFQATTVNFGASDVPMSPLDISGGQGGPGPAGARRPRRCVDLLQPAWRGNGAQADPQGACRTSSWAPSRTGTTPRSRA